MKITIIGAGPVGLMLACLLASEHEIKIYENRKFSREHNLNISRSTILSLLPFANSELSEILQKWSNANIQTTLIQETLKDLAIKSGVKYIFGEYTLDGNIIFGCDGSKSKIREEYFGSVQKRKFGYLAQLKFKTPEFTKTRSLVEMALTSSLNTTSGSDIGVNFESFSKTSISGYLSGTLNIPIQSQLYNKLSKKSGPWTLSELKSCRGTYKLQTILDRYRWSIEARSGSLNSAKLNVLELSTYKSPSSYKYLNSKHFFLVGDSNSGLIFERGLNKGWLEVSYLVKLLSNSLSNYDTYNDFSRELYNRELEKISQKSSAIESTNLNLSIASAGLIIVGILYLAFKTLL